MLNTIKQRKDEGFTIIEVMIVLAIAGLIMVIVFLAVPALQRNSRNTALNTDANNLLSGIGEYAANNGGTLPAKTSAFSSGATLVTLQPASGTANNTDVKLGGNITKISFTTAPANVGEVEIVTGATAKCNDTGTDLVGGNAAGPRSYAVLYMAEGNGSSTVKKCIGA